MWKVVHWYDHPIMQKNIYTKNDHTQKFLFDGIGK